MNNYEDSKAGFIAFLSGYVLVGSESENFILGYKRAKTDKLKGSLK